MKHHVSDDDAGANLVEPVESKLHTPMQLSRRARTLLRDMLTIMDARTGAIPALGKPPSAMRTMTYITGMSERNVRTSIRHLEDAQLIITYFAKGNGARAQGCMRITVVGTLKIDDICEECNAPTHGTGRWCADCKQKFREDREWQLVARFLCRRGVEPVRIAALVDRPLYVASQDDGRSANGGAVVPYLLGQRELGPEWAERLRDAISGTEAA